MDDYEQIVTYTSFDLEGIPEDQLIEFGLWCPGMPKQFSVPSVSFVPSNNKEKNNENGTAEEEHAE